MSKVKTDPFSDPPPKPMPKGERLVFSDSHFLQAQGAKMAASLPLVVFLEGEMGAGKTTLAQGILAGLGFKGEVISPTYALMHEYPTPQGLVLHVDAYRTRHPLELYEMGLEDYLERCRLLLIEWGEKFYDDFPEAWLFKLEYIPEGRSLTRLK